MHSEGNRRLVEQLRETVAALSDSRAALIEKRNKLTAEVAALFDAPLNREDTKEFMLAYVDLRAAEWMESAQWGKTIRELTYPNRYPSPDQAKRPGVGEVAPLSLKDYDDVLSGKCSAATTVLGSDGLRLVSGYSDWFRLSDGALFALFGAVLKPKLVEIFDRFYREPLAIDAAQIGPPISERRTRIKVLSAEIVAVEGEISRIEAEAAELGSNLRGKVLPPLKHASAAPVPAYELNNPRQTYTASEVTKITGMTPGELSTCETLVQLPYDPERPGIRYDAEAVRAFVRARAKI